MRTGRTFLAVAAVTLLLGPSCDLPNEPYADGSRILTGTIVSARFGSDSMRSFAFEAAAAGEYAVFLETSQGAFQLEVLDSTNNRPVTSMSVYPSPLLPLDLNATLSFPASLGQVFLLVMKRSSVAPADAFRFYVYRANPAPEHVPQQRFTLGDTVGVESIDGIADLDDFLVAGLAGQEFVVVPEGLGPAGPGGLGMIVFDSGGQYPIPGQAMAQAGQPATRTSGRLRFFESRDHRFRFRSIVNGNPDRFRGPYRFWSYVIDRAPEHLPAAAPIGTVVTGETIDRAGDVDEFTLPAPAGSEFNAFIHAGRPFQLFVVADASVPWANAFVGVSAEPTDTALFAHATGRFALPAGGPYRIRFVGEPDFTPIADTGAYRFFIYPINRAPEQIAATVTPGDTVSGEAIDLPGDVDEFMFAGAAGEEYNVLFQGMNGSAQTQLQLEAVDAAGNVMRVVHGRGADTSLFQHVTGRFTLPGAGTARLRVTGVVSHTGRDVGPYRLVLIRVNRQPETQPATLAFGDSLFGEAIDVPGDVDEFRVVVPDSSASSVVVSLGAEATEGLRVQLIDSATGAVVREAGAGPGSYGVGSGNALAPGTYILRVHDSEWENQQSLLRAAYSVWVYRFRFGAEVVSDTIAIGDTVSGEAIDPVADVDRFWFRGEASQRINIAFQGMGSAVTGGFQAMLIAGFPLVVVITPTRSDSLGANQSARIDLPYTGWYEIFVSGRSSGPVLGDRGPYRLAITELPVVPEQTPVTLALGDSVVSEQLDFPGDVDEYVLTALPGQMVALVTQRSASGLPLVLVYDALTRDTLAATFARAVERVRRFLMPASGRAHIAVYEPRSGLSFCGEPTCFDRFSLVGGFRLKVAAVNPAPEAAPATLTIGDTVSESLTPGTDLDEFTGTGTPGSWLNGWFRLDSVPAPAGTMIGFEVVDPATNAVLRGGFALFGTGVYVTSGSFQIPASGLYRLRVFGYEEVLATSWYRFYFRP